MNYSSIGNKSRKTGIFANPATKFDDNNLEDIDNFYEVNDSSQSSNKGGLKQKLKAVSQKNPALSSPQKGKTKQYGSARKHSETFSSGIDLSEDEIQDGQRSGPLPQQENDADTDIISVKFSKTKSIKSPIKQINRNSQGSQGSVKSSGTKVSKSAKSPVKIIKPVSTKASAKLTKSIALNKNKQSAETSSDGSIRRSSRVRVAPVAFWKNEKIVYEYSDKTHVPTLKDVVAPPSVSSDDSVSEIKKISVKKPRKTGSGGAKNTASKAGAAKNAKIAKTSDASHSAKVTKRDAASAIDTTKSSTDKISAAKTATKSSTKTTSVKANAKSTTPKTTTKSVAQTVTAKTIKDADISKYPKAKWMKAGSMKLSVYADSNQEERVSRTVAWSANKEIYGSEVSSPRDRFKLAILFSEDQDFAASGILKFSVGGKKHPKNTNDTYFIFYVIEGIIDVEISGSQFTVNQGCSFEIPMGNQYKFNNVGQTPAKLFFVQARCVVVEDTNLSGDMIEGSESSEEQ